MRQHRADYELAENTLKGKVKIDPSFGIFTAREIDDMLCNHLNFMVGKFGNELVERQPFTIARVASYDVSTKSFTFELEIDNFTDSKDTHVFLEMPQLEKSEGVDFTASEDRLTYTADISAIPPDALLEVYATGVSSGYVWRNFIASVANGEVVLIGSLPVGRVDSEESTDRLGSVVAEDNQVIIRLREPFHGKHNAVRSRMWMRTADKGFDSPISNSRD